MGGGEINVAYEGTFGDLSSAGDASLFGMDNGFMDQLDSSFDSLPQNDFTAINGNGPTISPKDVFNSNSVPPSTSFTDLTTPGSTLLETPDEGYEASPLFNDNYGLDNVGDNWYSLFPDDNNNSAAAPQMTRTISSSSANQIIVHPGGDSYRKHSSTKTTSPKAVTFSPAVKHSTVAGVNARKRDQPLPPIVVDESDPIALKRARNTAAARKSRDKKVKERETLESEIADLKAQVEHWKSLALGRTSGASSPE